MLSLKVARVGVAILARSVFLESVGRYNAIFQATPPTIFAQFVERVPMVRGRLDDRATTATGYAWFVWDKRVALARPHLAWVPPCRRELEKKGDYNPPGRLISRRRESQAVITLRSAGWLRTLSCVAHLVRALSPDPRQQAEGYFLDVLAIASQAC
jgi:hypothetical protein